MLLKGETIMKLINNNRHTIRQAKVWQDMLIEKETKKATLMIEQPQEVEQYAIVQQENYSSMPHIVFTKEHVGRDEEETQKIQEIHEELDRVPFSPIFAFA